MKTRKFWPLDSDMEGEIYENVAWDLPGFRRGAPLRSSSSPLRSKRKKR
jgi:hypothetical protein